MIKSALPYFDVNFDSYKL